MAHRVAGALPAMLTGMVWLVEWDDVGVVSKPADGEGAGASKHTRLTIRSRRGLDRWSTITDRLHTCHASRLVTPLTRRAEDG